MLKKISLIIFLSLSSFIIHAQDDTSHLRISLLTCGVGDEIWETFGHNGIRVIDSVKGTDMVYNYGTFDGFDKDFEMNFMKGKLLYYVSFYPYNDFMAEYISAKRKVEEQVLIINGKQKREVYTYLQTNALPENKFYKYDFFFDNCATRLRDIFLSPKTFGTHFKYAQVIPADSKMSYRNIINQYLFKKHWERFGINILLGSKIDKIMSNTDIMFLPDYLRDGMANATLNNQKVSLPTVLVLPGEQPKPAGANEPLIVTCVIAALVVLGFSVKKLKALGRIMASLLFLITGLLGCLIIVMWLGTNHQACRNNWNLLWALPTNLVFAFIPWKNKGRYALVGMAAIFISLILHVFRIQELPLLELGPILFSLLFVYGIIYKNQRVKSLS